MICNDSPTFPEIVVPSDAVSVTSAGVSITFKLRASTSLEVTKVGRILIHNATSSSSVGTRQPTEGASKT